MTLPLMLAVAFTSGLILGGVGALTLRVYLLVRRREHWHRDHFTSHRKTLR